MNHYGHSKEEINGTEQSLRDLLQSNTKILRIYQFDEEAKLNISVRDSDYFSLTKWIDHCLEKFVEYHPKRVYGSPIVRFATEVGSTPSDAKSKFSSKFKVQPSSRYDPTATTSVRSRRNAWVSGPPLELFFEAGKGPAASHEDSPALSALDGRSAGDHSGSGSSGVGGYGGHSASGKSGKSTLTQGTAPSTTMTQHLEQLVQQAIADTKAQFVAEFQALKDENQRIKDEFKELQQMFAALPGQISQAITGTSSPIAELRAEMSDMRTAMFEFMNTVKDSLPSRAARPYGSQAYDENSTPAPSPPRKFLRPNDHPADFPMADAASEGAGGVQ
jgi:FtsZ-binding cell division protein ZapB